MRVDFPSLCFCFSSNQLRLLAFKEGLPSTRLRSLLADVCRGGLRRGSSSRRPRTSDALILFISTFIFIFIFISVFIFVSCSCSCSRSSFSPRSSRLKKLKSLWPKTPTPRMGEGSGPSIYLYMICLRNVIFCLVCICVCMYMAE